MSRQEDDITYWRNKFEEIEQEYEEFRESSKNYEKELESSLDQSESTIKELRIKNNTLQLENDTLKEKYDQLQTTLEGHIGELEEETTHWHTREEEYVKCIRELEQKNDDLERSQRALYTSLAEFETKLNSALERNVFLESELDEKETLKTMVQRLKDEARDLKQEIQVRNKPSDNDKSRIVDSNKIEGSDTSPSSPGHMPPLKSLSNGMTPPSRISAMNIVGDILRRVGVLESKFAAASQSRTGGCLISSESGDRERYKGRLSRGTSSPSIHNLVRS